MFVSFKTVRVARANLHRHNMVKYDFPRSLYPFPLSYYPSDGGNVSRPYTSGDSSAINVGEDNFYILCCTPEEFNWLLSAVAVGGVQVQPDNFNLLDQLMMQAYEFPNSFGGADCVDFCQFVLDCIESESSIQEAIANYSSGSTAGIDGEADSSHINDNILTGVSGCDADSFCGFVTGIVDLINQMAEDILERWTEHTTTVGRAGDIIEAIPAVGLLPFDDLLQAFESFATDLLDNYTGEYDSALRQELICGLYCLGVDDCSLTFAQLHWFFMNKLIESLKFDTEDLLDYIFSGIFAGEEYVYAWFALITGCLYFGNNVFHYNIDTFKSLVSALYNDPDGDCDTLCTSCPITWWITFDDLSTSDFEVTGAIDSGWSETVALDLQSEENGVNKPSAKTAFAVRDTPDDFEGQNINISVELDATMTVDEVTFDFWFTHECGNNNLARSITLLDDGGSELDSDSDSGDAAPKSTWQQFSWTPSTPVDDVKTVVVRISAVCDPSGNNPANNFGFVDNITISGS